MNSNHIFAPPQTLDNEYQQTPSPDLMCNCMGRQNGEPFCPCRMRGVKIKDGRYVEPEKDLGPV